jgi:hypothetical protein
MPALYQRKVVLKDDGLKIEIGSIWIQQGGGATEYCGLGDRYRDRHAGGRQAGHRQGSKGLHATAWDSSVLNPKRITLSSGTVAVPL